ncbi:enoyl-CoA hydratase [Allopusillimonas ginsengisoli]|nr:enoyl-CoA hydratase [Allopusillimonas ginsengisoli]
MHQHTTGRIHLQRQGAVAHLIIDHPGKRNALTLEMWEGLPGLVAETDADKDIRIVVLEGAGENFAAGSDISEFSKLRSTPDDIARYNTISSLAVHSLLSLSKPLVARIKGSCVGAGMALAVHCDLRYATEDAQFSIPAGKLGIGYRHLWVQRLCALVGPAKAKEIMFSAGRYQAESALGMGLVNQLYDDEQFKQMLCTLCSMAPLSLAASKVAIEQAISPYGYDHDRCAAAVQACFNSQDYIEGRAAFDEKRTPKFIGH